MNARFGSYDDVALEYYDPHLHPTCESFAQASRDIVGEFLRLVGGEADLSSPRLQALDVGAGRSLLAQLLLPLRRDFSGVVAIDKSAPMLKHCEPFRARGLAVAVADASALPFAERRFHVVLASLADPYNELRSWQEIKRVLQPGGSLIVTMPAHSWATQFRSTSEKEMIGSALFQTTAGEELYVPSIVLTEAEQHRLFEEAGLTTCRTCYVTSAQAKRPISPKLLQQRSGLPFLVGYLLRRLED